MSIHVSMSDLIKLCFSMNLRLIPNIGMLWCFEAVSSPTSFTPPLLHCVYASSCPVSSASSSSSGWKKKMLPPHGPPSKTWRTPTSIWSLFALMVFDHWTTPGIRGSILCHSLVSHVVPLLATKLFWSDTDCTRLADKKVSIPKRNLTTADKQTCSADMTAEHKEEEVCVCVCASVNVRIYTYCLWRLIVGLWEGLVKVRVHVWINICSWIKIRIIVRMKTFVGWR